MKKPIIIAAIIGVFITIAVVAFVVIKSSTKSKAEDIITTYARNNFGAKISFKEMEFEGFMSPSKVTFKNTTITKGKINLTADMITVNSPLENKSTITVQNLSTNIPLAATEGQSPMSMSVTAGSPINIITTQHNGAVQSVTVDLAQNYKIKDFSGDNTKLNFLKAAPFLKISYKSKEISNLDYKDEGYELFQTIDNNDVKISNAGATEINYSNESKAGNKKIKIDASSNSGYFTSDFLTKLHNKRQDNSLTLPIFALNLNAEYSDSPNTKDSFNKHLLVNNFDMIFDRSYLRIKSDLKAAYTDFLPHGKMEMKIQNYKLFLRDFIGGIIKTMQNTKHASNKGKFNYTFSNVEDKEKFDSSINNLIEKLNVSEKNKNKDRDFVLDIVRKDKQDIYINEFDLATVQSFINDAFNPSLNVDNTPNLEGIH